ncbi:MAG: DNA (cytosine-5-)-methyltransferase [Anaerolineae bacterium]|nr:DNA (cytosine-5-)-methyltransferase [Anaerolineae bacterium]
MISNNNRFTVAEYFAGIGLVRLGLYNAGWQTVFANDFDEKKYEMYSSYFRDETHRYVLKDIRDLDISEIPSTLLATASFPCIDLSVAGNQNGINGKHSSAFWGFTQILKQLSEMRPPLVLLENVSGWLKSNQGADFTLTIQALNELGYSCDVYALDAIRFTPQSRLRIFVVGVRTEKPNMEVERLLRRPNALATKALKEAIVKNSKLSWNILDVPLPPSKLKDGLINIVEALPEDDPRWWNQVEVDRHMNMMDSSHLERVMALSKQNFISYRTMYRRRRHGLQRLEVRKDDTAGCLRTARGGSSRQFLVKAGHNRIRMRLMTPREYARLQGVPDEYPIPENTNQALTGFGDAVCVPLITWIAKNILTPIATKIN